MSKRQPRSHIFWYLALLCGLAYLPAIIGVARGDWPFPDDAMAAMRTWRELTRQALQAGQLPLWNPRLFCGIAFMSDGQTGVLYAPNLIYWVMPVRVALLLDAIVHNVLLLIGTYCLARALRLSQAAAMLAAIAFGLSGAVAGHIYAGHTTWHAARAYLPWELWALLYYLRTGQRRYAYGLAALFACQVASGSPPLTLQSTLLCSGLVLAWIISHGWSRWWARGQVTRSKPFLPPGWPRMAALVVLLAGALAAICLLPLQEMSRLSVHGAGLSYQDAVTLSASWRSFARLLAPNFFGGNQPLEWSSLSNPHEEAAYAGLLPLILALGAPLLARRSTSAQTTQQLTLPRAVPWLWALLPLTAVLALGDHTPLYHWLFDHVSLFRRTRVPARWLEVWCFAVALLAAFSFDGCRQQLALVEVSSSDEVPRSALAARLLTGSLWGVAAFALTVGLAVLTLPLFAALWLPGARILAQQIPSSANLTVADIAANFRQTALLEAFMVCLLASLLACLCGRWQQAATAAQRYRLERLLIAAIAADVLFSFWRSTRLVPAQDAANTYFWPTALTRLYHPGQRWDVNVDWVAVNAGVPLGIDLFNGYDPLSGRRYFDFVDSFEGPGFWDGSYRPRHHPPLLRVAGVTHTLVADGNAPPGVNLSKATIWRANGTRMTLVSRAGTWSLWQHDGAWPLVYLSRQIWRLPEARQLGTLNTLATYSFAAQGQPVVGAPGSFADVGALPLNDGDRVFQWSRDWNEMKVETQATAASVLTQSEAWYPGWRAWVNGQAVPLERANFMFRGVQVPAGVAQIRIIYAPATYSFGLFLSLCGLCGLSALGVGYISRIKLRGSR